MSSSSGLTRRRGGGGGATAEGESSNGGIQRNNSSSNFDNTPETSYESNENGHKIAFDPRDISESTERSKQPKLTLMEEVLLLGLKDKQVRSVSLLLAMLAHTLEFKPGLPPPLRLRLHIPLC
jgi:golgi phosphoprotein 3